MLISTISRSTPRHAVFPGLRYRSTPPRPRTRPAPAHRDNRAGPGWRRRPPGLCGVENRSLPLAHRPLIDDGVVETPNLEQRRYPAHRLGMPQADEAARRQVLVEVLGG